jgi:hypothetical protein
MPENRDVPIHVIGPPDVIAALDDWNWTPGLLPASDLAAWPMADFRDRFLDAFVIDDVNDALVPAFLGEPAR